MCNKTIQLVAILFTGLTSAIEAAPVAYNINFSPGSGTTPTSGVFTYDAGGGGFSNFVIVWNGFTFDMTSSANSGPSNGGCGIPKTAGGAFGLMAGGSSSCNSPLRAWDAISSGFFVGFAFYSGNTISAESARFIQTYPVSSPLQTTATGDFTISQVPEPGRTLLVSVGLASILLRRQQRLG